MKSFSFSRACLALSLMLASAIGLHAATFEISGTVTSNEGEPLVGATVIAQGTKVGTATDIDGRYSLPVPSPDTKITASYVGYEPQTLTVGNRRVIDFRLVDTQTLMDEVVVLGYATQKKSKATAAVSAIGSDDITRSTSTTTGAALVGKISGVTYRQMDGTPGSSATLQIRNMGTPLYVIDGIMRDEEAFNTLNINDIENISVLKDGAAAIYGVRAANGVVLITTKTGQKGHATVNVNANVGWQQWTSYPRLLNPYQWVYANDMALMNTLPGQRYTPEQIDDARSELAKWKAGGIDPETGADYRGYDWYGNFVRKAAPQYNINGNISGGTDRMDYYFSLSHLDQEAVFKDFKYDRTNIQGNFNLKVSDRFRAGFQVQGKIATNTNPACPGTDDYFQMRQSVFNLIPTQRPYANDNPDYIAYISPTHDSAHNMAGYTIDNVGLYQKRVHSLATTVNLQYDTPLQGLMLKGLFSYTYYGMKIDDNEKSYNEYTYDPASDTYNIAYTKSSTYRVKERSDYNQLNGQITANFDRTFDQKHHVTAVAGFEFYKEKRTWLGITQHPVENPFVNLLNTSENNQVGNTARNYTTASWVFRAGYDFEGRYLVDFAGRYDASWRFQRGHQWGFFPSVSAAWRLSEEPFYKELPVASWLNNIKLRGSYGEIGDDMADTFNSLYPDFAYMNAYTFGGASSIISPNPLSGAAPTLTTGSYYNGVPQTGLTWMKISMLNIGLELGFLNNRLRFEFDMFRRHRRGIPATPTDVLYPLEAGYSAMRQNLNSDEIRGLDFSIKWNDRAGSVNYWASANLTLARQKTLKNYGETFFNAWDRYRYGQSNRWSSIKHDYTWQYEVIGVFQTQEQIDNYPVNIDGQNNRSLMPGDYIFKDVNGDGRINEYDYRPAAYGSSDKSWIGESSSNSRKQPLITMGISLGLEWRGIDFAADFAGAFLNTYMGDWHQKYGVSNNQQGYYDKCMDAWHHQDIFDPTSPWVPGKYPALRDADGAYNPCVWYYHNKNSKNVNYLRLRNLVVGYTLPKAWTTKAYIQRLRIYFEGTNLFCIDNMDLGLDPEVTSVFGFDYPQHRVYSVGINLTF